MSDQATAVAPDEAVNKTLKIGEGKPGPGRPKGVPNRTTALLKDAILQAAQRAGGDDQDGLVNYLTIQAKENPGPFLSLLGKVLPLTLQGDKDAPILAGFKVTIVDPAGRA